MLYYINIIIDLLLIFFQHKSTPYCNIPCYSALFGPKLFGHGSTVESHQSFGQRSNSFIREQREQDKKIREYNVYHGEKDGARLGITHREVNGRLVMEGVLRVYWGVDHSIRLREYDDKRVIAKQPRGRKGEEANRKCYSLIYQFDTGANSVAVATSDEEEDEEEEKNHQSMPSKLVENDGEMRTNKRLSDQGPNLSRKMDNASGGGEEFGKMRRGDRKYKTMPARVKKVFNKRGTIQKVD